MIYVILINFIKFIVKPLSGREISFIVVKLRNGREFMKFKG
ncbi:hypothetical protein HMPREF1139_0402 [Campylobacter sp. FOBRC14]|nr:hypothetical protein HMPREF1139_0402 [Campylobacter sp. FOBRC14]